MEAGPRHHVCYGRVNMLFMVVMCILNIIQMITGLTGVSKVLP